MKYYNLYIPDNFEKSVESEWWSDCIHDKRIHPNFSVSVAKCDNWECIECLACNIHSEIIKKYFREKRLNKIGEE